VNAPQVFATATVLVLAAIAMTSVGVGLVAGAGWALVASGLQLATASVGGAVALLREDGKT
jgi:hypothetical protein